MDRREDEDEITSEIDNSTLSEGETHATTGGAAAAGAVTGGVIGLTGGPIGAAIGAVGGAIVGAAAERMMHSDDGNDIISERTPVQRAPTDAFDPDATTPTNQRTGDVTNRTRDIPTEQRPPS